MRAICIDPEFVGEDAIGHKHRQFNNNIGLSSQCVVTITQHEIPRNHISIAAHATRQNRPISEQIWGEDAIS